MGAPGPASSPHSASKYGTVLWQKMQVSLQTPPARRPGPLADHHRVALEAEAARLEHVRDRQQQLARVRPPPHLDAGEVLAVAPADDARDPVEVIAVLRRRQLDEARAVALDEPRRVVLEAERRAVAPSAANGAWIPAPAGSRVMRCIGEPRQAG